MAATESLCSIVVPVSDLSAATAQYTALLGAPHTATAYYVGFRVGEVEIGLNPNADVAAGPVAYWSVPDVADAQRALVTAGATIVSEANEVGGGTTIGVVADADGNPVGLLHAAG